MAETKTKPTGADVGAFLDAVTPDGRREDGRTVCALMQRVSGEPPVMWGPSIVGFGRYRYRHDSGRGGEMPRLAFSPRKAALTLYLHRGDAELMARLGRHTVQGSCLYVKRLADVDCDILERLIRQSLARSREIHPDS